MACTSRYYMNPAGCERFPHQPSPCLSSICSSQDGREQRHCRDIRSGTCTTLGPMINRQHTGHAPPRAMVAPITLRPMLAAGRNNATRPTGLHFPTLAPSDTPRLRQMSPGIAWRIPTTATDPTAAARRDTMPIPRMAAIDTATCRGRGRARPRHLRDLVLGRQSRSRRAQRRRALDGQSYVRAIRSTAAADSAPTRVRDSRGPARGPPRGLR
ncbi:hypothetical protein BC826DRAFT_329922 [Russula brevipes]|nr:hypothetical protein BC826DRAFT_329922 [Russula brevipes]